MQQINWGIIGCGDVTEIKSGPAFNKVRSSRLVAVMRRNADKARDYAARHHVPKWYTDSLSLIEDPDVNAIYVATPPSSHEEYTLAAIDAGKPVYVEKPMSVNFESATRMANAAREKNIKLCVAHYRRAQPFFGKVKQLLDENAIGDVRFVQSELYKKSLSKEELESPKIAWRVDPSVAGGGLFHDLSPHQFGLMYYFFGHPAKAWGISLNTAKSYKADDVVAGNIVFENGILFNGVWCFNVCETDERDSCEIFGDRGRIKFSFFDPRPIEITKNGETSTFAFDVLEHVQQPMIEKVVEYFLDQGPNPCTAEEGTVVMQLIDEFTTNKSSLTMIFREAKVEDIPQLQIVRNSVKENTLSDPALVSDKDCETYLSDRGKGWACEIESRIVAFAIVDMVDNNVWALFVHPTCEGQGIGKKLHDEMLDWYFGQTDSTLWLGTAPNTRAEKFYRKAGWKEVGVHGKGEIKFEMSKDDWKKHTV